MNLFLDFLGEKNKDHWLTEKIIRIGAKLVVETHNPSPMVVKAGTSSRPY